MDKPETSASPANEEEKKVNPKDENKTGSLSTQTYEIGTVEPQGESDPAFSSQIAENKVDLQVEREPAVSSKIAENTGKIELSVTSQIAENKESQVESEPAVSSKISENKVEPKVESEPSVTSQIAEIKEPKVESEPDVSFKVAENKGEPKVESEPSFSSQIAENRGESQVESEPTVSSKIAENKVEFQVESKPVSSQIAENKEPKVESEPVSSRIAEPKVENKPGTSSQIAEAVISKDLSSKKENFQNPPQTQHAGEKSDCAASGGSSARFGNPTTRLRSRVGSFLVTLQRFFDWGILTMAQEFFRKIYISCFIVIFLLYFIYRRVKHLPGFHKRS